MVQYRSDITGLRAIAIIPIVLFHAGMTVIPGGFLGVDIFFVISGFLITSIITADFERNSFSILEFYRRRVARIFPALVFVLITTVLVGSVLMLPLELTGLSESAAMASIFLSNVYFFKTVNYFGASAEMLPLLHTWSLAVEEQFYIFYPIALMLIWKFRPGAAKGFVIAACLGSFAVAAVLGHFRPSAAFYLTPARAWELGLGALVALGAFPPLSSRALRQALAVVGLALIVSGLFLITPGPLFPAPLALVPSFGAALLIAYGHETLTDRLLSLAPLRWFGDISYSLYLWHWPVITFYRLQHGIHLDPLETAALFAVSTALAYSTFVWVEKPGLRLLRNCSASRRRVVLGGLAALVATAGLTFSSPQTTRLWRDLPPDALTLASYSDYVKTDEYAYQYRRGVCFMGDLEPQIVNFDCLGTSDELPDVVVLGDSHAAQFWRAIDERLPGYNVIQATASGCLPVLRPMGPARCTDLVEYALAELTDPVEIEAIILSGRWSASQVGELVETVKVLRAKGLTVVVIGPTVEYDGEFPNILARAAMSGAGASFVDFLRRDERTELDRRMAPLIEAAGGEYVSAVSLECPAGECAYIDPAGVPFHFDYGHLTMNGARALVAAMALPARVDASGQ